MGESADDPTYIRSRREAVWLLLLWSICCAWSVGYCYVHGYSEHPRLPGDISSVTPDLSGFDRTNDSLTMPFGLGFPDWAFWGLFVPWLVCVVLSIVFSLFVMKDNPEQEMDA